jgi:DTW domain-containing protein YfiP
MLYVNIFIVIVCYCSCFCGGFSLSSSTTIVNIQDDPLFVPKGVKREYCKECNRPPIQCLCDFIPKRNEKIDIDTKVLILQHPVEARRKTVSTVPLMNLVLKECQVLVGRSFDDELEKIIDQSILENRIPLVLFPDDKAITLDDPKSMDKFYSETNPASNDNWRNNKYLLVIVDGTWTQAKRMVRYSPILLEKCQAVQFKGTSNPSIYDSIRKQPETFCLSTLESCARTLKLLEPNNYRVDVAVEYLYASLKALIRTQMEQERIALEKYPESIRNSTKIELKMERQRSLETSIALKKTNPLDEKILSLEKDLGNGYKLRPLRSTCMNDIKYVDSVWPHRSKRSFNMIERQITSDNFNTTKTGRSCCLGVEYAGCLVGCIIRHQNGSLGILHVDSEHRQKGLGEILLKTAMDTLLNQKESLFVFILDGNKQSEALFTKLGWALADSDSNLVKRSG